MDKELIHSNSLVSGSRFAADFDYKMHHYNIRLFESFLKNSNCLELGCYHGAMTKKLANVSQKVTAIDFDDVCVASTKENCREESNVTVLQADFFDYEGYEKHDVIYFSHTLEHIEDDRKLLEVIYTKMKKDALLITIVPNGESLSRKIAVKMGIMEDELIVTDFEKSIGHFRTYSMQKFQELFKSFPFSEFKFGGIMPKIFSNHQFDQSLECNIIDDKFLDALFELSDEYTQICASIYSICKK